MSVVVRGIRRAEPELVDGLAKLGVPTVQEARGRSGLLDPVLRPIHPGARIAGTAVTVNVPPGDTRVLHVAVPVAATGLTYVDQEPEQQ